MNPLITSLWVEKCHHGLRDRQAVQENGDTRKHCRSKGVLIYMKYQGSSAHHARVADFCQLCGKQDKRVRQAASSVCLSPDR